MRLVVVTLVAGVCACGGEVRAPGLDGLEDLDGDGDRTTGDGGVFDTTITPVSQVAQSAMAGKSVSDMPVVVVRDASGRPLAGQVVHFTVELGDGAIDPDIVITGADGQAALTSWRLGKRVTLNRVHASLDSLPGVTPASFDANVSSDYAIAIDYRSTVTAAQRAAFEDAAARWSAVIVGDLPDVTVTTSRISSACVAVPDGPSRLIDDLVVFATVTPIDGLGGTLAQSGPCLQRSDGSIVAGVMIFDSDDLDFLESNGVLEGTVMHEMGHVIGFGSLWRIPPWDLVVSPSLPSSPGANTRFSGATAGAAFISIGGMGFGGLVPVDNTAVPGSADVHWRETELGDELMTPEINGTEPALPLSIVTVAAFADLGVYTINDAASDDFQLGAALRADSHVRPPPIVSCTSAAPSEALPLGGGIIGLK